MIFDTNCLILKILLKPIRMWFVLDKKCAGAIIVVGLIIVGTFIALEFTGTINFIDYQP